MQPSGSTYKITGTYRHAKKSSGSSGIAGIASAVLGGLADKFGIEYVYQLCAYMPLLGLIAWFLPDIRKIKK